MTLYNNILYLTHAIMLSLYSSSGTCYFINCYFILLDVDLNFSPPKNELRNQQVLVSGAVGKVK